MPALYTTLLVVLTLGAFVFYARHVFSAMTLDRARNRRVVDAALLYDAIEANAATGEKFHAVYNFAS